MIYVPRTKTDRNKLRDVITYGTTGTPVILSCGHVADKMPELSNPDRWWHCGEWRHRSLRKTKA